MALSCLHLQTSGGVGSRPSRSRQDRHADACCQALTCTFVPFTFFMASGIAPCDFHTHLVRRSSTNLSDTLCAEYPGRRLGGRSRMPAAGGSLCLRPGPLQDTPGASLRPIASSAWPLRPSCQDNKSFAGSVVTCRVVGSVFGFYSCELVGFCNVGCQGKQHLLVWLFVFGLGSG